TQSGKKAFSIPDVELPHLWKNVREIYDHQAKYKDNTKDAVIVMRYTERYSELKRLTAKKKGLKGSARRATERIYTFLSYSFRPSHRTRFLKQKMTRTFEKEAPRK